MHCGLYTGTYAVVFKIINLVLILQRFGFGRVAIHIDFYQLEFEKFYFSTKISFTDKILSAVKSRKNH